MPCAFRELPCCDEGNTLRIRALYLATEQDADAVSLGFSTSLCYDEVARLIVVVRSSFLRPQHPCRFTSRSNCSYITSKEYASPWNKERLSGSMTRRATASSAARMGKTCLFTILRSRPMVSAACRRARRSRSTWSKDPRAGRRRTYRFCRSRASGLGRAANRPPFLFAACPSSARSKSTFLHHVSSGGRALSRLQSTADNSLELQAAVVTTMAEQRCWPAR